MYILYLTQCNLVNHVGVIFARRVDETLCVEILKVCAQVSIFEAGLIINDLLWLSLFMEMLWHRNHVTQGWKIKNLCFRLAVWCSSSLPWALWWWVRSDGDSGSTKERSYIQRQDIFQWWYDMTRCLLKYYLPWYGTVFVLEKTLKYYFLSTSYPPDQEQ